MKVTVRKIAELAGVSRGTVDRVLNGRPGVKPEIRENVLRIAAELNYVPNMAAKALAYHKKPAVFGIVMPPEEITFFEEIRRGIHAAEEELKDLGCRLEFRFVSNREPSEAVSAINELVESGVSGILFSVMDAPRIRETIDAAVDRGVPVLTFNSDVPQSRRLCFVGQDLYNSGRIAAGLFDRIAGAGFKTVVVTGNKSFQAHKARVDGFVDRAREQGAKLEVVQVLETYDKYKETYEQLWDILTRQPEIRGIYMATGHIGACVDVVKKLGVERKVHIICNDLLPIIEENMRAGIIDFSIVQDPFIQGYRSLKILYDYIFSGRKPDSEFIYTETGIKILESL